MATAEDGEPQADEAVSPRQKTAEGRTMASFGSLNSSLDLDMRADPDAQATVTDFLDFTEYLPADMIRSLTLIGKLDQSYIDASTNVHNLTTTWGRLPDLPAHDRPTPVQLRADISTNLHTAVDSRIYSHQEAVRMAENTNRHYNRAKKILAKLETMMENYPPVEEQKSPVASKSPQMMRNPKFTLRVDSTNQRGRRQRVPRITVPGDVLAPYEVGFETYTDESEESDDEEDDESLPARSTPAAPTRIKLVKNPKVLKSRMPKATTMVPLPNMPNSGLSTSSALAQFKPPPENAVPGSTDAPWLQLTPYELAKLRKRMKKNAQWSPSETMIARELKLLGRDLISWKSAKQKAEEESRPFESSLPIAVKDADGVAHPPLGALSIDAALAAEAKPANNRGDKLNEAKKLKKETMAQLAAKEAEESTKRLVEAARAIMTPIRPPDQLTTKATNKSQPKKRKREAPGEVDADRREGSETPAQRPQTKRTKTETPVPIPQPSASSSAPAQETPVHPPQLGTGSTTGKPQRTTPVPLPIPGQDQSLIAPSKTSSTSSPTSTVGNGLNTVTTSLVPVRPPGETSVAPPLQSPKKSTTPILPPVRETRTREAARKEQQKDAQPLPSTRPPSRSSRPATPASSSIAGEPSRRPLSRGKAMSQEPQPSLAADRPRRASTARNTPAPEARPPGKRPPRPAPGVISRTNSGGNSAVGRRKAATRKKRGSQAHQIKKEKTDAGEVEVEVDDEGNVIDPDEPRYCLCNRVSFGVMIQCDNVDNCKQEWFHLECVDMADVPARTTKWYCPDCRVVLKIGEKGEVNARGVRM